MEDNFNYKGEFLVLEDEKKKQEDLGKEINETFNEVSKSNNIKS